ncbi:PaaX family transcriptional regulator C-terminal domain-containing protein [Kitasatospora sp. NPDC096147]|uniref:PaaX family transcriptional regulator C-terminal domain-containing protein n=1 Tax=Kitasatospora sp. NPDC096147 TaxID=3364093 RepID=UPI003818F743
MSEWPPVSTRLLVHALVRTDGTVDAAGLYAVAPLLGMTDQQVRLCLKRLVAEGRFAQEGRGRKAVIRALPDASGELTPDAGYVRYAYRQDRGGAPWDGRWRLIAFAVPEARRAARDQLRELLRHLGAAPVQSGLYATPNPITGTVLAEAARLGLGEELSTFTSTDLRLGATTDPVELAARLWPLPEIAGRYGQLAGLAEEFAGTAPADEAERLTRAVRLAAAFTLAIEPDPLLPPELLPQPWPGRAARRLAAECWRALEPSGGDGQLRLFARYRDVEEG